VLCSFSDYLNFHAFEIDCWYPELGLFALGCCNGGCASKFFNLGYLGSGKVSQTEGFIWGLIDFDHDSNLVLDVFVHYSLPCFLFVWIGEVLFCSFNDHESVGSTFRVECVELGLVVVVVALFFLLSLALGLDWHKSWALCERPRRLQI